MTHPTSPCRTCRAPVYWLANDQTRRVAPIDVEPVENGNVEILDDGFYRVHAQPTLDDGPRYLNHFVTCGNPPKR